MNFQLGLDTLPKDKAGYPHIGGIDLNKYPHEYGYFTGIGGGTKSDGNQDIGIVYQGVFPADTWHMVAAGTRTLTNDDPVAIISEDLSMYPEYTVGVIWLLPRTNNGRILPSTTSPLTGMFLQENKEFSIKTGITDIINYSIKNETAGDNVILEYAAFVMPVNTTIP